MRKFCEIGNGNSSLNGSGRLQTALANRKQQQQQQQSPPNGGLFKSDGDGGSNDTDDDIEDISEAETQHLQQVFKGPV